MIDEWKQRMRAEWDLRARQDAEYFIYTRDTSGDVDDFAKSGEANYNQLVRPYLPMLLSGREASVCNVVEIGCGIGRMTEFFARDFASVAALDVAPAMIEGARNRLSHLSNVAFHVGTGADLQPVPTASADLVFSYIVFQHIPSRAVIESYFSEAARVLRDGGTFKFQVNGDQSEAYLAHERDTWLGETFSVAEVTHMLAESGFTVIAMEGAGTQYFLIAACKGVFRGGGYVLPGDAALLEGFGAPVDSSWSPLMSPARVRLTGEGSRLYAGIYFWPGASETVLTLAGYRFEVSCPGDHYFEFAGSAGEVEIQMDPVPARPPAFRIIGLRV